MVSDTVVFEYKAGPTPTPTSPASAPLPSLDFRRFSLLQRLQRLHGRLQVKTEPIDDNNQVIMILISYFRQSMGVLVKVSHSLVGPKAR